MDLSMDHTVSSTFPTPFLPWAEHTCLTLDENGSNPRGKCRGRLEDYEETRTFLCSEVRQEPLGEKNRGFQESHISSRMGDEAVHCT